MSGQHHIGPTDSERQVLAVNDVFFSLLNRRSPLAAQLAQELAEVAAKYSTKKGT